jgi:hypothetical protein
LNVRGIADEMKDLGVVAAWKHVGDADVYSAFADAVEMMADAEGEHYKILDDDEAGWSFVVPGIRGNTPGRQTRSES